MSSTIAPATFQILIADDDRDTVDSFALLMGLWGHAVFRAYTSAQALAVAREHQLDAAMLDLAMPGQDGLSLAKALRPEVALLWAVTGFGDARREQECREAGFDAIFIKPLDPEHLREVVAESARLVAQAKQLSGRTQELIDQAKRLCADSPLSRSPSVGSRPRLMS